MSIDLEDEDEQAAIRCRTCDRQLVQGMDVIRVQSGVLGPRGLVPLTDAEYFCSRTCLEQYCDDEADDALGRVRNDRLDPID